MSRKPPRIVLFDVWAEDRFHLAADDRFLARALAPLGALTVVSAPGSIAAIRALPNGSVQLEATVLHGRNGSRVPPRVRCTIRSLLLLRHSSADLFVFQSFEELTAFLMVTLLKDRVVLIVTNNLAGLNAKPLKRAVLKLLTRRAAAVVVYTRYEENLLVRDFGVPQRNVLRLPFHQMGIARTVKPLSERSRICFFGWAREGKGLRRFIDLIAADTEGRFGFGLYGQIELDEHARRVIALACADVEVQSGYLSDEEYFAAFERALFVVLPYEASYEGKLSGIFCDAVATGTPVIVPDMEPYREFFERYGPLGIVVDFDRGNWMHALFADDWTQQYPAFQAALLAARADHAFDRTAEAFRAGFADLLQRSMSARARR